MSVRCRLGEILGGRYFMLMLAYGMLAATTYARGPESSHGHEAVLHGFWGLGAGGEGGNPNKARDLAS